MTRLPDNWPAKKIENRPVSSLIPYARNARTHSDEQVKQIADSIREWGWTVPVLIDEKGEIIAGHGRVLAAELLEFADVPALVARGWSEAQKRAYRLADNQLAMNAGWDNQLLREEVRELDGWGFDVTLLGFDNLAALVRQYGLTDPDDAPPAPQSAVTKPGQILVLGDHRVLCGDATNGADVALLLQGVKPNLMVTDPPYGVNYDPAWRPRAGVGSEGTATGKVTNDDRADWSAAWEHFPGAVAYVWHGGLHSPTVAESLRSRRFDIRAQIVWVKTRAALSRGNYHWQHEPCMYAVRDEALEDWQRFVPEHEVASYFVQEGKTSDWKGGRKQSTVWFIEHLKCDTGHGTQKPVECMKRPIENNSSPGMAVYDPFLGSGTTVIAAEMTGRVCYGLEVDPKYCDVIASRWEAFTGREAQRHDASVDDNRESVRKPARRKVSKKVP